MVVPLYKGKGSHQCTDNYQGINLLSIPGKVYALLLMHRLGQCVGGQLHEAQCGFRGGKGTIDAMFVLRHLSGKAQASSNVQLHLAFIDLAKSYDSVNREALWQVLHTYGVPERLINLLQDLHLGT